MIYRRIVQIRTSLMQLVDRLKLKTDLGFYALEPLNPLYDFSHPASSTANIDECS